VPLLAAAAVAVTVLAVGSGHHGSAAGPPTAVLPASMPASVPTADPIHRKPCPTTARACIDLRHRVAWLQRHGRVVYGPVPVSLGRRGHRTPRGTFHVSWKAAHWTSTEYGLPMPWSVFFAAGGIALHAGPLDRRSHGCVHLRMRDARYFFHHLRVGDEVDDL
jgi:hypothetical protein